nr:unnamed protein product [Callosobruchus chinensis]
MTPHQKCQKKLGPFTAAISWSHQDHIRNTPFTNSCRKSLPARFNQLRHLLLSHRQRRGIGDVSLFYRYSNGFCFSELTSIIPPHINNCCLEVGYFQNAWKISVTKSSPKIKTWIASLIYGNLSKNC